MTSEIHEAAIKIADELINLAFTVRAEKKYPLLCRDCLLFPSEPVTGPCGHTRCLKCVTRNPPCFCGSIIQEPIRTNVLVNNIVEKFRNPQEELILEIASELKNDYVLKIQPKFKSKRYEPYGNRHPSRQVKIRGTRFRFAMAMFSAHEDLIAVSHLAHVAVSDIYNAKSSRQLLIMRVQAMLSSEDREDLKKKLIQAVVDNVPPVRLKPEDVECAICFEGMYQPVTSPCGHTFCQNCILRLATSKNECAICRSPINVFNIYLTAETEFLKAAMSGVVGRAPRPPPTTSLYIPILICTITIPTQSYPIIINSVSDNIRIRRLLFAGKREIGVLNLNYDNTLPIHGTVVEITDFVQLEDGRAMLSSIGRWRFQALDKYNVTNGILRVLPWTDLSPNQLYEGSSPEAIRMFYNRHAILITIKSLAYFSTLSGYHRSLMQDWLLPNMPLYFNEDDWWLNPHGAEWLWWLVANLPIRPDVKLLLMSTDNLCKRLEAVNLLLSIFMKC